MQAKESELVAFKKNVAEKKQEIKKMRQEVSLLNMLINSATRSFH